MKITIEQLSNAVMQYFESEIYTKAVGFKKFTLGAAYVLYRPKLPGVIVNLLNNPLIKMLDIVDENGLIDLDKLYSAGKESIRKSGQFEIAGILFNESDIDRLYSIAQSQGG